MLLSIKITFYVLTWRFKNTFKFVNSLIHTSKIAQISVPQSKKLLPLPASVSVCLPKKLGYTMVGLRNILQKLFGLFYHKNDIWFNRPNEVFFITDHSSITSAKKWVGGVRKCTPSIPEIIWVKNVRAIVVCGF